MKILFNEENFIYKTRNKECFLTIVSLKKLKNCTIFLTEKEKIIYNKYTFDKRKNEYLASRIASKESIIELYKLNKNKKILFKEITIKNISNGIFKGKPYFIIKNLNNEIAENISITHSNDFAISCCSKRIIGIDVEKILPKNSIFIDKIFTENEKKLINKFQKNENILKTLLFSYKESFSKCLGIIFFYIQNQFEIIDFSVKNQFNYFTPVFKVDKDLLDILNISDLIPFTFSSISEEYVFTMVYL